MARLGPLPAASRPPSPTRGEGNSLHSAYDGLRRRFREAGLDTPDLEARVLLEAAFGQLPPRHHWGETPFVGTAMLDAFAARRLAGEPAQRIVGRAGFWTLDLAVSPDTLVPRPETELIVETCLDRLRAEGRTDAALSVLDLGTGTGALLLSLLSELPRATGLGVDRAHGAVTTARENAGRCGLAGRARFAEGDWATGIDARFDLVVSNPPYIESAVIAGLAPEVRDHDPLLALDGGGDGLEAYRAILPELPRLLAARGFAVLECGQGQAASVAALGIAAGLAVETVRRDLAGIERVVSFTSAAECGEAFPLPLASAAPIL